LTREPIPYPESYGKLQMSPYDNEVNLAKGYIATRLETKTGDSRTRFLDGEYQDITELRVFVPRGAYQWPEFMEWCAGKRLQIRLVAGLDLGYQDGDAFVIIAYIDGLEDYWVIYEHKTRRQDLSQLADAIKRGFNFVRPYFPHLSIDSTFIASDTNTIRAGFEGDIKKNWRLLSEVYGFNAGAARKTGTALSIELLREDCNSGRLHVPANGVFVEEAEQTVWTKNRDGDIERIIDDEAYHPDLVHAVRYAFNYLASVNSALVGREVPPRDELPEPTPIRVLKTMAEEQEALDKTAEMWDIMTRSPEDY